MAVERPPVVPITAPDDPRLVPQDDGVAGADQIAEVLALSPRERLRYLVETLRFEERAHRARPRSRKG